MLFTIVLDIPLLFSKCKSFHVRWMQIRRIGIKTADGLSPMPVSSGWVRDGLFVIGMDSEFAIYSQWRSQKDENCSSNMEGEQYDGIDTIDHRHLQDSDLINIAQVST